MWTRIDKFWHKTLRRPYRLAKVIDEGAGPAVVLLHGIGRTARVWQYLAEQLAPGHRVVALDLLGFGGSPKPAWASYNADDHAGAVIASLDKLALARPILLVGHSMGCLVAVRVAIRRPDLAQHLVLYEMPLYSGLPDKRLYRLRLNFYRALYGRIVNYQPAAMPAGRRARLERKLAGRLLDGEVEPASWLPFARSLKNTVLEQTTAEEIKRLAMPVDIIYGSRDRLVIRGETKAIFGEDVQHVTAHTIAERHQISKKASLFLAERIEAAMTGNST